MSEAETKRARIKSKIAASQTRLKRDAATTPARKPMADDYPPEQVSTLAGQYPLLTVAAGVLAGVALAALLPRAFGGKFARRAVTLATVAGELGLAASQRARHVAEDAGRESKTRLGELGETIGDNTDEMRRRAGRIAGSVAGGARSTGLSLVREAVKLAARARR